jgi:hypothetical protein
MEKKMVFTLNAQMQNVDCIKANVTGQMDFTVVWYSTANISLPSNNLF